MSTAPGDDWAATWRAVRRAETPAKAGEPSLRTLEAVWREYARHVTAQERKRIENHLSHGGTVTISVTFS